MKHQSGLWCLFGFTVTSLGGTVLHYLYDWSGELPWIAPFSGVNESTWEHIKLLFWPMLVFAAVQSIFFRDRSDFWCVKLRGILIGLVSIPLIFYTYNGVIGRSPDWINIAIFFVAAALSYRYEWRRLKGDEVSCPSQRTAVFILSMIALLFIFFTFAPLPLAIFKDPLTGAIGI